MSKLNTYFVGYLKRPYLWRDLLRQPSRMINISLRGRERTRVAATEWADEKAITTEKAIRQFSGRYGKENSFIARHAQSIKNAEKRVANCPVGIGGAGNLELVYALCLAMAPTKALETGVAYGWTTLAILLAMKELKKGELTSIDRPDMTLPSDQYVGCAVAPALYSRWKLYRGVDRDKLPQALVKIGGGLEFVHYDSDKSYFGRMWAYRKIWPELATGGVLISDDISDNAGFMDFCAEVGLLPIIVKHDEKYVGILKK